MVKLFIGNLNPKSDSSELRQKFEAYGTVTECDIVNNYGFVHMEKESDAQAAMAGLQGSLLDGSKINVELSRGKRTDGFGPFRRRGGRFRGGPPDRMHGPPRYMEPYPSMQPNRFGPRWDDNYGRPYGIPSRGSPRGGYDYPVDGPPYGAVYAPRYDREPMRPVPKSFNDAPPMETAYRGPPSDSFPRDYSDRMMGARSRHENYDNYDNYDRYRDTGPSRSSDYYANYGGSSGRNYDDSDRVPAPVAYESGYDYGYYDYSPEHRNNQSRYAYGR